VIAKVVTLKATGNQWYWTHNYPDLGVEVTSNMLPEAEAKAKGEPRLLAVDNRIVLPVNTPIRLLTTANDVIHAWAIPAFWIKLDAVPGRINETSFMVEKTGVYYGQCSELCGIKHGFMPIGVEVVSKEDFATWIRAKGGKMPGDDAPAAAASTLPAAPAAASK
jgi:cytochrome c oxidase subunit II